MLHQSQIHKIIASMILVYGDDSSDEKRERVSAVAVVIGTEEMWDWLEQRWLIITNGTPFHAKDCESDHGDYEGRPHEHNKELYKNLTTMLAASELGGLGIGIDLAAQREIFPQSLDLAYYKAFSELLDAVLRLCSEYKLPAKFTFDIGSEHEYNAGLLYQTFRESNKEMKELFDAEISFAHARNVPRLQVADLLAYEAMKAMDHSVGPVKRQRKSWDVLRQTERFETLGYSHDWFRALKANLGELERKNGFNGLDYQQWLKDKGRQHSISNLFHFLQWIEERKGGV